MTTKTKALLIGVPVAIGVLGFAGYKYVLSRYSIKPNGGSVSQFDYANNILEGTISFELKSNIGVGFIIEYMDLDVFFQNVKVAHISKEDKIDVPKRGSTIINVPVSIDLAAIKQNGLSFLTSTLSTRKIEFFVDGFSKGYIKGVPISVNVSVNEKFDFPLPI